MGPTLSGKWLRWSVGGALAGGVRELYMIGDYDWLPRISVTPSPGMFADVYRATWDLTVSYPPALTAIVDGEPGAEERGRRLTPLHLDPETKRIQGFDNLRGNDYVSCWR